MVTQKKKSLPVSTQPTRAFYLKEWRKFMGTKPVDLAEALDIERQSYHRLEKHWWTISAGEMDVLCKVIGIEPSQLWFPPPTNGRERISLDELLEDMPETMQQAAILAIRGMARK